MRRRSSKCPQNGSPTTRFRAGFLATARKLRSVSASTLASRRTISRRYRCSAARCTTMSSVVIEVKEVGSRASVRERRQKVIEAARRRDIDVVIVWRLDIVLLRKAARILASVPRPPACFFHAETLLGPSPAVEWHAKNSGGQQK